MQETTDVEPVANPQSPTGSAENTFKPTEPEAVGGGEPTEWEYEFSTCADGRVMFIHLWDRTDLSACERLMHRPIVETDITRSPTGNAFVTDSYGNKYTFHRSPIERSYTCPDLGDLKAAETTRRPAINVMDILASI